MIKTLARAIKERNNALFFSYCSKKFTHKIMPKCKKIFLSMKLYFFSLLYPKIVLTRKEYKIFKRCKTQFKENYENIILLDSAFFRNFLKNHVSWMESSILCNNLNNKYSNSSLSAHQAACVQNSSVYPPPPLLNPDCVLQYKVSGELAYWLHLPIQEDYKFILIAYGSSGHLAWLSALQKSNIFPLTYKEFFLEKKDTYAQSPLLELFLKNQVQYDRTQIQQNTCLLIDHIWQCNEEKNNKILAMSNHEKEIIFLVRDPIARIKHSINHGFYKNHDFLTQRTFRLQTDPRDVVNRVGYQNEHNNTVSDTPILYGANIHHIIHFSSFAYAKTLDFLPKNARIRYFDIESIMPRYAFDTITNLAKEFHFDLPKEEERGFYEEMKTGIFRFILPLTCIITTANKQELQLFITLKYTKEKEYKDVTQNLFLHEIQKQTSNTQFQNALSLLDEITFSMKAEEYEILQNDSLILRDVQSYMQNFLIALKARGDYIQKHRKTEEDILECLSMNRELLQELKTLFDRELAHLKLARPDIVKSWKYYNKFEELCKEHALSS